MTGHVTLLVSHDPSEITLICSVHYVHSNQFSGFFVE